MLLRLVDQPKHNDDIEIILQTSDGVIRFTTEYFPSPLTENLHKTLVWYFQKYPQSLDQKTDDKKLPEKIVKLGQYMGDGLLGEDHQLIRIRDVIEDAGYEQLTVQLESSRIEFFQEYWETLILPDAKYVLSSVSKTFVRRFIGEEQPDYNVESHYQLSGVVAIDTGQSTLTTGDTVAKNTAGKDRKLSTAVNQSQPLTILHVLVRPSSGEFSQVPSRGFNASIESLRWGEAVSYELWPYTNWPALQQRLENQGQPVHILHYDGPVVFKNGTPFFGLDDYGSEKSLLSVSALAELLVCRKIALLSVDACVYQNRGSDIAADLGLASIAYTAAKGGMANVLGLSSLSDPWTAIQCFQAVYDRLAGGLSLGQAIVEARKWLQTQIESQHFRVKPVPFHPRPLLVHYGGQSLQFFKLPQQQAELSLSPTYGRIRRQLLGFRHDYLPPQVTPSEDGILPDILRSCRAAAVIALVGQPGSGKSHAVHQTSFYLVKKKRVRYGFYFHCATEFYRKEHVLQMIAPVLGCQVEQPELQENTQSEEHRKSQLITLEKSLFSALAEARCCFVFDDVIQPKVQQWLDTSDNIVCEFRQFMDKLIAQDHIVMVTGETAMAASHFSGAACREISATPLSALAQKALAAETLRQHKIEGKDQDDNYLALLHTIEGHPFLIRKVLPRSAVDNAEDMRVQVADRLSATPDRVNGFYAWQWALLPPAFQKLILLLVDFSGVLLEVLMLVCDQREPSAPESRESSTEEGESLLIGGREKRSFEPAAELFSYLGDSEAQFSEALDQWHLAGFVTNHPHGRVIDSHCIPFLKAKRSIESQAGMMLSIYGSPRLPVKEFASWRIIYTANLIR